MEKLTRPLRTESKSNFTYIYHNFVPHFLSINEKNKVKWLQNFETTTYLDQLMRTNNQFYETQIFVYLVFEYFYRSD